MGNKENGRRQAVALEATDLLGQYALTPAPESG